MLLFDSVCLSVVAVSQGLLAGKLPVAVSGFGASFAAAPVDRVQSSKLNLVEEETFGQSLQATEPVQFVFALYHIGGVPGAGVLDDQSTE